MRIGDIAVGNTSSVYVMKDAKVFVQGGGELVMERSSEYIVEGSAETEIGPGGLFQTHGDAATFIRAGGVFRVKDGGTLRLVDESKLLVEVGGKLILEDGAIVQLWDDSQPDGLANIHVQGELVVEGDINFSGRGFFQFDYGNLLTLTNGFELTGSGQGTRFIRLNQIAELKTGGHLVRLSDGKVEYEAGSSISLGIQGSAIFSDVDFVDLNMPGEAFALQAIKTPAMISVTDCTFDGLASGIAADNIQGQVIVGNHSRFLRVSNSQFIDCEYGITVSNTQMVEVVGSSFTASSDLALYGIYLKDVGNAYVKSSSLSGYGSTDIGAVWLHGVPDYNMVGGSVSGNALGIRAVDGQNNIDMVSQATVSGNVTGINMEGGSAFGVLTMDCARLLDNATGVLGNDVTLNIDASGDVKPNHFRTFFGSPLFKICYAQLAGIIGDEIDAKDNYWEGDIDYKIYNPGQPGFVHCNHFFGNC